MAMRCLCWPTMCSYLSAAATGRRWKQHWRHVPDARLVPEMERLAPSSPKYAIHALRAVHPAVLQSEAGYADALERGGVAGRADAACVG